MEEATAMHLVVFKTSEGKSAYHQAESLDEALRFVERVRNHESVSDARLYRLTEIPLEIKTYYKVEIAAAHVPAAAGGATAAAESVAAADGAQEPVYHTLTPQPNGR